MCLAKKSLCNCAICWAGDFFFCRYFVLQTIIINLLINSKLAEITLKLLSGLLGNVLLKFVLKLNFAQSHTRKQQRAIRICTWQSKMSHSYLVLLQTRQQHRQLAPRTTTAITARRSDIDDTSNRQRYERSVVCELACQMHFRHLPFGCHLSTPLCVIKFHNILIIIWFSFVNTIVLLCSFWCRWMDQWRCSKRQHHRHRKCIVFKAVRVLLLSIILLLHRNHYRRRHHQLQKQQQMRHQQQRHQPRRLKVRLL